jgi:hypothetical protein
MEENIDRDDWSDLSSDHFLSSMSFSAQSIDATAPPGWAAVGGPG